MKNILITGASGQDGQILSYKLQNRNCKIVGLGRSKPIFSQIVPTTNYVFVELDLADFSKLEILLDEFHPDIIFNLASMSSVKKSWEFPEINTRINEDLPIFILDWIFRKSPNVKFIQASSSEIFGGTEYSPQNERTDFFPITPYGNAKANAHKEVMVARNNGLSACNAILYNHESPLRNKSFITKKITRIAALYKFGVKISVIPIGNSSSKRDWGWAPDYVDAMLLMMDAVSEVECGFDYVIASGIQHSVIDLMNHAFEFVGFKGWEELVLENSKDYRKIDPSNLLGDPSKIANELGWLPRCDFQNIIQMMITNELALMSSQPNFDWLNY